jgi:hypothetical protein
MAPSVAVAVVVVMLLFAVVVNVNNQMFWSIRNYEQWRKL